MKDDILIGDTPKARRRKDRLKQVRTAGRLWKHSTLADVQGLLPEDTMSGLLAFTLVRNPWDRAVSYYHWLQDQSFEHPAVARAKALGFEAFIADPATRRSFRTWPASAYMRRADGTRQTALYIRLEHFRDDAAPLFAHLGFEFDMPEANASRRERDWTRYYSASTASMIAEDCAEDIARFGYAFDT